MVVDFLSDGDSKIVGEISWEPHCIINPAITGQPTLKLGQNLPEFIRLSNRFNYLETLLQFFHLGLGYNGKVLQDIYIGHESDVIYGITLDREYIKLLGKSERVDLFEVYEQPDLPLASKFNGYYSNGHLNTRDCIGWYPIIMPDETLAGLREREMDLGLYFVINRWINNKVVPENITFGLTIDAMIARLDAIIKWEKLLGACYHNVEQVSSVEEVPLVMNQVITGVEPDFARHYLYLLNGVLRKTDDIQMEYLFITIRYLVAHYIRRCEQ